MKTDEKEKNEDFIWNYLEDNMQLSNETIMVIEEYENKSKNNPNTNCFTSLEEIKEELLNNNNI